MSRFVLLLGGDLTPTAALRAAVAGARVIAADAGIAHCEPLGVVPELWVGDFDSVPAVLPPGADAIARLTFPPMKDKTDGELALDCARERGATEVLMVGAFGGPRADHAFLHLTLALESTRAGLPVTLTSGDQEGVPLLQGRSRFDYSDATVFSILAFSDLDGLSVSGAVWPLDRVHVGFGSSLTLSNVVEGSLEVTLGSGRALLLAQIAHASPTNPDA